jgi:hypothetical protein
VLLFGDCRRLLAFGRGRLFLSSRTPFIVARTDMSEGNSPPQRPREWTLEPETEYRFELDPDTTLAIKVSTSEELETTARGIFLYLGLEERPFKDHSDFRPWGADYIADQRTRGNLWRRAHRGQDLPLHSRMQSCVVHMAWVHD